NGADRTSPRRSICRQKRGAARRPPLTRNFRRKRSLLLLLGLLLLALLGRARAERLAAVEVRGFRSGPLLLLAATGSDVVRLLARLPLVERGVELGQDVAR